MANVNPAALWTGALTPNLQPERTVRGTVTVGAITRRGQPAPWRAVYLHAFGSRPLLAQVQGDAFNFNLPPGSYGLDVYGTDLQSRFVPLVVSPGDGDDVLPAISLTPTVML